MRFEFEDDDDGDEINGWVLCFIEIGAVGFVLCLIMGIIHYI